MSPAAAPMVGAVPREGRDRVAGPAAAVGLAVRSVGGWPESDADVAPPPLAGFVVSSFSPLVAETAERCLRRHHGTPPVPPPRGERTAVVLVSVLGDVASAVKVAHDVDAGARVGPLLFFQSVPNAVAGYVAARWGLGGPVVCTSPVGDPLADGLDAAALLIADGDADEALVVVAEQAAPVDRPPDTPGPIARDTALAVLVHAPADDAPHTAATQTEGVTL